VTKKHLLFSTLTSVAFFAVASSGCVTKHVGIDEQHSVTKTSEVLVRQVEYSPKGLPVLLNRLLHRPHSAGDRFTIVYLMDGRPTISYDIAVVGPNTDFTKPFKVIYEWTGKGFQIGALGTAATLNISSHAYEAANSGDDVVIMFAVILAPLVVGTAGGFVIGVADGIKTSAEEVYKVVLGNYEQIVTYTTYAYDACDRLVLMRMYKADESRQELVRTEYTYEVDSAEPIKTVIRTYPAGTLKTVQ
jgi:hypothetical protein